jgi:hypothetical protein
MRFSVLGQSEPFESSTTLIGYDELPLFTSGAGTCLGVFLFKKFRKPPCGLESTPLVQKRTLHHCNKNK